MQKTSARLFIVTATLLIVSIVSCKKGDTGPAGPAGPTGATGAPGPTGPQGNANVMVDTFTVKNADWLWNSAYILSTGTNAYTEYFTRYHDQAFTKITKDVLASGMVLVYFAPYTDSVNGWVPLPFTFLSFGSQYYVNIVFVPTTGSVRLHYFYTANGPAGTVPNNLSSAVIPSYRFKIVAVTGTVATGMQQHAVDVSNYNSLSKYLGL